MILWKCLHFCEENAASQQNVGTVGLSYFSDIRVKPAAPGPKTPGGDPETGAAQCRSEVVRQRPLGLRVDLIQEHGVAQPLVQHNVAPGTFEQLTGQPSQLVQAVLLCVVGFLAIYGIELLVRIIVKKEEK